MEKRKHHFVPVFYLNLFASEPKRIHLYNLERDIAIQNAPLRGQCYKNRFHGKTNEVEDAICEFEGQFAPVIKKIIEKSELPEKGSQDYETLTIFVAFQMLRTSREANKTNLTVDKLTKLAYSDDIRFKDTDWDSLRIGYENPVVTSLLKFPEVAWGINDLRFSLICLESTHIFATSDNPVFKYNQFYEKFDGIGVTGAVNRGLQIFVPLSPHHILFLCDRSIYSVTKSENNIVKNLNTRDIDQLNLIQATTADRNIYFNDWEERDYIRRSAVKSKTYRKKYVRRVEEYPNVENKHESLLHTYEQIPNLELHLSFVRLTKQAKQCPKKKLLTNEYRHRKLLSNSLSEVEQLARKYQKKKIFRRNIST